MTDLDLMLRFMLQILVVLTACRLVGWFGQKYLGQAQVTMEMLTGVILGPSVFGAVLPQVQQFLFPQFVVDGDPTSGKSPSMSVLFVIAQVGLVLYIFLIGLEFDSSLIRSRVKALKAVSATSIGFPILLGGITFYTVLNHRIDLFGPGLDSPVLALYVGATLCITAFPMLARIVQESGLAGTSIGTLTIGAGAVSDVAAWILLSVVLALSKGNPMIAVWAIGGGTVFSVLALTVGRTVFAELEKRDSESVSTSTFGLALLALFVGAWITDEIGVYAVFGAFIVGAAMPRGRMSQYLKERIEPLTTTLFLPFFFVFSGLSTKFGTISSLEHWLIFGLMLVVAVVSKFAGCFAAARLCGESKQDSMAIGFLMNTRGLMELILLNIGLQQKIITPTFFAIMVLVAIVTTMMTAPLVRLVYQGGTSEAA